MLDSITGVGGPSPEAVIRVRDVTKSFGGAAALKNVSLDVHAGEVHALMGMNGAGKSTLVKILSGAHNPDLGHIEVADRVQTQLTPRRARRLGISTVPQRRELVMSLTVAENIMLGDLPNRRSVVRWRSVADEARAALDGLGISIDVGHIAGDLTVAEQTMVEVAREVRRGGRVLILDEPTACLGADAAEQIRALVRRLRDGGVAVVYISHHIDEVLGIADRITVLRDGAVVRSGVTGDIDERGLVRDMAGRDVVSERPQRAAASRDVGLAVRDLSHGRSIDGFHVEVRKGEIVAVLGPAGDAQSRLFDLLSGRRRPDRGALCVDGRPVPLGSVSRALGSGLRCVTGDRRSLGLIPDLSIDENLLLAQDRLAGRRLHRSSALARRAAPLRDDYRVVSLAKNPPVGRLSGGNQQKVLLAKWLGTRPAACFLEDPTNGVDVAAMADIHTLIDALAREGVAVLLASSSAEEVMRLADRVIVVRGGRMVAEHEINGITRDELVATVLGGELS
ncbi:sugar ABC transporter ATP-binding protein [Planomonospora venezuelensis]|uniref:Ribose transport system ATP-binding protein/rhamnose transport system ATP-binding protein n=1 Tax=Planomonospora venezuelensis TaxID=1999 RepID=A0A841DB46_PLAVE|nr:sugar ABC transporter ATP-binding protein [Planomonospora venezuelensis]MBB5967371.1 ribose transport system ATP-binding protein/rhamnose transport system ATP-binding protein [Planomonospora venezuelensis]GIN03139.1 ribose import ATP-binding protein RbsA [Planomonospora venezuelensis]